MKSTNLRFLLAAGILIILVNLIKSARHGEKTTEMNPWGGTNLEWQIPTPPPLENFDEIPTIDKATYKYD